VGDRGRWLAVPFATLLTAALLQSGLASTAAATRAIEATQSGTATLTIEVNGLPRKVHGSVKLAGPGKTSRRITSTTKLTSVRSGAYTITAQAVVSGGKTYHPTIALCSSSGHCSSPSHGRITVKALQRGTVRVTYSVSKTVGGTPGNPTTPGGASPPGGGGEGGSTAPTLPVGATERGGWSARLNVAAGGLQSQVDAVITFPTPLRKIPRTVYLNEKQVEEPGSVPGCAGDAVNPVVLEPGVLCVYMGATATNGSLESEWQNAKFFALEDFAGNIMGGKLGELVVFRTTVFNDPPTTIPAAAALTAAGSWAVTEG
jgi:hypothetical protein